MNTNTFLTHQLRLRRGLVFGVIIITALLSFEMFNYSTTDYALNDLLGDLKFLGIRWATILAIAFCGIDFAGIARLFTPGEEIPSNEAPTERWYLFGAWLLAATMNALLTWWGVSLAVLSHQALGNEVVGRDVLVRIVPIFVAVLVWLIRVLIIGTFSVAGDRMFNQDMPHDTRLVPQGARVSVSQPRVSNLPIQTPRAAPRAVTAQAPNSSPYRSQRVPVNKSLAPAQGEIVERTEPTYHPISSSAQASSGSNRTNTSPTRPSFVRPNSPGRR